MRVSKIVGSIFHTLAALFVLILAFMFTDGIIKAIIASNRVKSFIRECEYERQVGSDTLLYSVDKGYGKDFTIKVEGVVITLGNDGDYFTVPYNKAFDFSLVDGALTLLVGGHAGITGYLYGTPVLVEAMGGTFDEDYVDINSGNNCDIYKPEKRSVIGFRINGTEEEREQAFQYALTLKGKGYNYIMPITRKDKYYCADLVSRVFKKEAGIHYVLNDNPLYVSTQSLSSSNNSSIIFFKYIDSEGMIHVYYAK